MSPRTRRIAAALERQLAREGMPRELPNEPSWRKMRPGFFRTRLGSGASSGSSGHVVVEFPHDRDGGFWTVKDRARNFLTDAETAPDFNAALEDLFWRGDWQGYPKWQRDLVWQVVQEGVTVAEFARARRLRYMKVRRALIEHMHRAGMGRTGNMDPKQQQNGQQAQGKPGAPVRVKAVFSEKLPPALELGHVSWVEGELTPDGRFVKVDYPEGRPHKSNAYVLIPVGPGVSLAVLRT